MEARESVAAKPGSGGIPTPQQDGLATQWWERAIVVIPALAAISIAALYGVGALLKAAQLQGAGFTIRDTLPLFPLETILGAGISVAVQSLLALVLAAALGIIAPRWASRRLERSDQQRGEFLELTQKLEAAAEEGDDAEADRLLHRLKRRRIHADRWSKRLSIVLVLASFFLVGAMLLLSPVMTGAMIVAVVAPIGFAVRGRLRALIPYYILVQYLIILTGFVVYAFAYPEPLPTVNVHLNNGQTMPGRLIVATESTWYVGRGESVIALPLRSIDRAKFQSQTPPRPASTGTHLLNWLDEL